MTIGEAIKDIRVRHKISQVELAKKADITQGFLSLIEKGEREPNFELIRKIAKSLQVPEQLILLLSCKTPNQKQYAKPLSRIALAVDDILKTLSSQAQ